MKLLLVFILLCVTKVRLQEVQEASIEYKDQGFRKADFLAAATSTVADLAEIRSRLGLLLQQNKGSQVLQLITRYPAEVQETFDVQHSKARALAQTGQFLECEALLQTLMTRTTNKAHISIAQMTLGKVYVALRRFTDGERMLSLVLQKDGNVAEAWLFLGKIYMTRDQDYARAKTNMVRAFELNPNDERIAFEYAMLLVHLNDAENAHRLFQHASVLNPSIDHKYLGKVYLHMKRPEWAVEEFRLAGAKIINYEALQETAHHLSTIPPQSSSAVNNDVAANVSQVNAVSSVSFASLSRKNDEQVPLTPFDEELFLLWADCEDHQQNRAIAHLLFDLVLEHNPKQSVAHLGKALALLGTGSGNFGALSACGLHQQSAIHHLQQAADLPLAQEALQFCVQEIHEAQQWRQIILRDFEYAYDEHSDKGSTNEVQEDETQDFNGDGQSVTEEKNSAWKAGVGDPSSESVPSLSPHTQPSTEPLPEPTAKASPYYQSHQQRQQQYQQQSHDVRRFEVSDEVEEGAGVMRSAWRWIQRVRRTLRDTLGSYWSRTSSVREGEGAQEENRVEEIEGRHERLIRMEQVRKQEVCCVLSFKMHTMFE